MHHQAGRLVDHDHLLVLMDDGKVHRLGAERLALGGGDEFDTQPLAGLHATRRGARSAPVEPHVTAGNQRLQVAARELGGDGDQGLVESLAMQRGVDFGLAQLRNRRVVLDLVVPIIATRLCRHLAGPSWATGDS